ncbi:MAG: hypothetical protein CSA72_05195 [Rhodobacterales bacterium]|nr:MAG: hypothetical protein CSA72_05195 [Rhodobacterales bacterium]
MSVRQVKRRRVFYIPGYDPFHPRRYRELYRSEGAEQARISGYDLTLKGRQGGVYGWDVWSAQDSANTETSVDVLVWSDIVRDSMAGGIAATYGQLLRTAWVYISSGALFRLAGLRKGPVIAALYPVVALILQLWAAIIAAWLGAGFLAMGLNALGITGAAVWAAQVAVALGIGGAILRWFRKHDGRFFAYYLMHDYAFSARWRGADPPALRARMKEFEGRIAAALSGDADEVLIVGHSSGAHIGVSVLAEVIRAGRVPEQGPTLSFLSLGQVVPMVSFLPDAGALRGDLAYLSTRPELFWMDVTAPGDGCAFALCDPVAVSGVAPQGQLWPRVISAAFTQTLSPARWKELRRRFFRLHFQYLCAFDRPGDYDYFRITAGPQTLAGRYADRAPSPARITRPANRYRSTS